MTNGEQSESLLRQAAEILLEVDSALGRGSWNLTVRRSQEVVELALKAILRLAGIEVPRTHDPAPLFVQALASRGVPFDAERARWLIEASHDLGQKRAPSFYHEAEMSESEARGAAAVAREVVALATAAAKQLAPPSP